MATQNNKIELLPQDEIGIESLGTEVEKMPKRYEVENIQEIDSELIEELECGDIVVKITGDQKHSYRVSYKEEHKGICLTYVDASVSETVSYDYNGETKEWDYNSTDVTPLIQEEE